MTRKIKKRRLETAPSAIKKTVPHEGKLTFSFSLFDGTDVEVCADRFPEGYTRTLMERLSAISGMTEAEFRGAGRSLRSHTHQWENTSRPDGFIHLNDQLQDYPGWQFCLSANQHGRVHGIMIDNVFYVIWLDLNHALYP